MPPAYLAPNITTLPSCQVLRRQASRQPHPPPALAVSFARRGHAAHHLFRLAGPAPFRPQGRPLVSLCSRAVTAPRFATGLSRLWDSGFFLRSLRLPGDLALLGRPEAGLTFKCLQYARSPLTPDGDRRLRAAFLFLSGASQSTAARRLLCPCGLLNLFFLFASARQTSLRSDCLGRALSQPSP